MEKKNTYNKKLKEYERQKQKEVDETKEVVQEEKEAEKAKFEQTEKNIVTKRVEVFKKNDDEEAGVSNMVGDRKRHLPSFWMPSMAPQAKKTRLEKPDKTVYCPMSRKPIRMKDFTEVKWTFVKDPDEKRSMISR